MIKTIEIVSLGFMSQARYLKILAPARLYRSSLCVARDGRTEEYRCMLKSSSIGASSTTSVAAVGRRPIDRPDC